jgi:uncharacterized surface protein with fasciclin (FAS1) repeats
MRRAWVACARLLAFAALAGFALSSCANQPGGQEASPQPPQVTLPKPPQVTLPKPPQGPTVLELAAKTDKLTTLMKLVKKAGLEDVLKADGPITVFAPADNAPNWTTGVSERLTKPENRSQLRAFLLGHVVDGRVSAQQAMETGTAKTRAGSYLYLHRDKDGKPMANDAHIVTADIAAGNGVVHIIDQMLLPRLDLVATARKEGQLTTFLKAVEAADLTDTLRTSGPLTILAPGDEAFKALGTETLADLLKPANKAKLAAILKYHVVPGWKHTYDKQQMQSLPTLHGARIPIESPSMAHWKIQLGGASLKQVNIDASNGVLHTVDQVLMPKP